MKIYSYDKIYEKLIQDISLLETVGFDIEYKGVTVNLKGTISIFVADNLASNALGGFVESFTITSKINYFFV